jgi:hypothetical protein
LPIKVELEILLEDLAAFIKVKVEALLCALKLVALHHLLTRLKYLALFKLDGMRHKLILLDVIEVNHLKDEVLEDHARAFNNHHVVFVLCYCLVIISVALNH